jgi:hypothetical protein
VRGMVGRIGKAKDPGCRGRCRGASGFGRRLVLFDMVKRVLTL